MAVTVQEEPFAIGWAGCRNRLKLRCTGGQRSAGTAAHFKWTFPSSLGNDGCHVVLIIDGFQLTYTIGSGTDSYSASSRSYLTSKIRDNYYVQQLFSVTRTTSTVELTALAVGHHVSEVTFTDQNGVKTGDLTPDISDEGSDRTAQPNFALMARVEAVVNDSNVLSTHVCDGMVYNADANGDVTIDLAVIRDFLPPPDLPTGSNVFQLLTNAMMKYRVGYGEMWGEGSPRMQNWGATGWYYALCGEEVERHAALNLPDWKSGQSYRSPDNGALFWIIGEDTGKTMRVRRSQCEYLYGLFYDAGTGIGDIPASGGGVAVTLTGTNADGTTVTVTDNYTPVNGQVYRIDVSPSRFGVNAEVTHYTVNVRYLHGNWSRSYIVMPDFYRQTQFLLQTKYGVLKSIVGGTLRRELQTEAEAVKIDSRRYLEFTERGEVYSAVLSMLTKEEARRVGQCLSNEYHYVHTNGRYERVTIEAGSFALRDDDEGWVTVEFQFRFVENQQENATHGDTSRKGQISQQGLWETPTPLTSNSLFG